MSKQYMICPECGRKWRCVGALKCKYFTENPSTCPCDVCHEGYDIDCMEDKDYEDVEGVKEKVIFT